MKLMLGLAVVGLVIAIGGMVFGVLAVGVPHPEPTPVQAVAERANVVASGFAIFAGGCMVMTGFAGAAVIGTVRWLGSRIGLRKRIETGRMRPNER